MPIATQAGSIVTGASIVDGSISNADISPSAAIALSKLASLVGNPGALISIEQTLGTTHSLTTIANQKVLVIAKGWYTGANDQMWLRMKYNGVSKDLVKTDALASGINVCFTLMYMDTPGAATADITISGLGDNGGGEGVGGQSANIQDPVITVIKLQVG